MIETSKGNWLIEYMLREPFEFHHRGLAYELLQEYFHGHSIETLGVLLSHEHQLVRRAAAFIAAELGFKAKSVVGLVAPLVNDIDDFTVWSALESLMLCSTDHDSRFFFHVVSALQNRSASLRRLSMRLTAKATESQLIGAVQEAATYGDVWAVHLDGLSLLTGLQEHVGTQNATLLKAKPPLLELYIAIAIVRSRNNDALLLDEAMKTENADVRQFLLEWKAWSA